MKLRAIVYNKAVEARFGQLGAHKLDALGAGADGQFRPLQGKRPLFSPILQDFLQNDNWFFSAYLFFGS